MAMQPQTTAGQVGEKPVKSQLLVVDLEKRQSAKQVKRLRKGKGKLMARIEGIVEELVQSGAVKSDVQPVVIVVREEAELPWPFG
jgi:hypothetical protein